MSLEPTEYRDVLDMAGELLVRPCTDPHSLTSKAACWLTMFDGLAGSRRTNRPSRHPGELAIKRGELLGPWPVPEPAFKAATQATKPLEPPGPTPTTGARLTVRPPAPTELVTASMAPPQPGHGAPAAGMPDGP